MWICFLMKKNSFFYYVFFILFKSKSDCRIIISFFGEHTHPIERAQETTWLLNGYYKFTCQQSEQKKWSWFECLWHHKKEANAIPTYTYNSLQWLLDDQLAVTKISHSTQSFMCGTCILCESCNCTHLSEQVLLGRLHLKYTMLSANPLNY